MNSTILVIMAGGKSSRMQQDKALLPFGNHSSLAQYQYERFKPFFSKVYISAKENKFNFAVDVIEDCYSESSPLVGLISLFETLDNIDKVIVLSVDAPFVTKEVFNKLLSNFKEESSVIVAESPNGIEPLCAIYRDNILPVAKAMLNENRHRLQRLLESVNTQKLFFKEEGLFMNLNYPSDYQLAKRLSSNI